MNTLFMRMTLASALVLAAALPVVLPESLQAARRIAAADNPERLVDIGLERHFTAERATAEMRQALTADDIELSVSLLALADERHLPVPSDLREKIEEADGAAATALRATGKFVDGFVVGAPDDLAGVAGMVTGDLMVYGDVRDVVRETTHLVRGQAADELVLGLACVGLAVTAGTYVTLGAGAPARVGLSVVKAAGKTGRLSARLASAFARPLRAAVDTAALKGALSPTVLLQPGLAVHSMRAAVKLEKAESVVRLVGDVGRVQSKAGTRAALETLRLAESPQDVAKLARVAESKGSKTRGVLKILGRGAIALTIGLWQLTSWTAWGILLLLGFVVSLKRFTEGAAARYFAWRRRARLARALAAQPA